MPTDFPANRFYFVYGFVTGEETAFYMDSVKQKNRRGFTLAELLVAITVGLIVIASLLSLVVMMNSYLVKRTATSKLSSELYHVKNEISGFIGMIRKGICYTSIRIPHCPSEIWMTLPI